MVVSSHGFVCLPQFRLKSSPVVQDRLSRCNHRWGRSFPALGKGGRHALIVKAQLLSPPNDEADWVIADVLLSENLSSKFEKGLDNLVEEDTKTLLRVALRDAPAELSVLLCDNEHIRSLNSRWRGKDTATDVLSFPQNDPDHVVLGDIVINVEQASAQCNDRGIDLRDEIRVLLVHGLLHLLGYDHEGNQAGDWLVVRCFMSRSVDFSLLTIVFHVLNTLTYCINQIFTTSVSNYLLSPKDGANGKSNVKTTAMERRRSCICRPRSFIS